MQIIDTNQLVRFGCIPLEDRDILACECIGLAFGYFARSLSPPRVTKLPYPMSYAATATKLFIVVAQNKCLTVQVFDRLSPENPPRIMTTGTSTYRAKVRSQPPHKGRAVRLWGYVGDAGEEEWPYKDLVECEQ
jgi:hypothetical protein